MSGGSMDYLYQRVRDARFVENTPLRRAFRKHLNLIADTLRAIEWNDSGDGDDREEVLIRQCLGAEFVLQSAMEEAEQGVKTLADELRRLKEQQR